MVGLAVLSWVTFSAMLVIVVRILRLPDGGFGAAHRGSSRRRPAWARPALTQLATHHPSPARR